MAAAKKRSGTAGKTTKQRKASSTGTRTSAGKAASGRKAGVKSSVKRTASGRGSGRALTSSKRQKPALTPEEMAARKDLKEDILLVIMIAAAVFLMISVLGFAGRVGSFVATVMFGIFGFIAYIIPAFSFFAIIFCISNRRSRTLPRRITAAIVLLFVFGIVCELTYVVSFDDLTDNAAQLFTRSAQYKGGGGVLCGIPAWAMMTYFRFSGTILILLAAAVICVILITGRSFTRAYRKRKAEHPRNPDAHPIRDFVAERRASREETRRRKEERRLEAEERRRRRRREDREDDLLDEDPSMEPEYEPGYRAENRTDEGTEIEGKTRGDTGRSLHFENDFINTDPREDENNYFRREAPDDEDREHRRSVHYKNRSERGRTAENRYKEEVPFAEDRYAGADPIAEDQYTDDPKTYSEQIAPDINVHRERTGAENTGVKSGKLRRNVKVSGQRYVFPSLNLLERGKRPSNADTDRELRQTARKLQDTLQTFGVNVTMTDISQGPSVTRYEMQPERGIKVSKILSLSDDIKLSLAALDIRIEAPIPGKSAIGIEVPNKENTIVALRDLLESKEFRNFKGKLPFAVGRDIAGKVVVTDIAKMPHLLIAGATGSGKSVCINTIIMSILYRLSPDEVRLLLIDPKVVELSVYNGIPHLLLPVVTDTRKASAALNWAVAEMTRRYKQFAEAGVRDLEGYNAMAHSVGLRGDGPDLEPMPRIVVIVDELADLMMVAKNEVETAICRLAQLARAAGIHLIIATQRPSVDVITGLIKANMPSRIAFAVTSQVDSRTILDMAGGEKLIGKGDMLFYPLNYQKPARIQGAFVSDNEVSDVVEDILGHNRPVSETQTEELEKTIEMAAESPSGAGDIDERDDRDEHFADAGRLVTEKKKASIGMLQRMYRVGFNRASRIMSQLCEAGVVSDEDGTKARRVLMSSEEFENYLKREKT